MQLITRGQTTVTDLTDGYTVQLLPSNYTFQGSETAVSGTQSVSTMAYVRRGTTVVRANVNVNNIITPTGITVTSDGATPSPTLTITATSSVTNGGYFTIPIYVTEGSDTIIFNQPFSYSIAYTGEQGEAGQDGQNGTNGIDGVGITQTEITYGHSSSPSTQPTSWSQNVPSLTQGEWLWVKTIYTYSDNSEYTTYSKSYIGTDGEDGKSVYVQSSSKVDGRTTIILTDGTDSTTLTIDDGADGINGINGINGTSEYVHFAWANSSDGTVDFSTSVSEDKSYIGVYSDENEADSELPNSYNWSLIKGADGQDGDDGRGIVTTSIEYGTSNSSSTEPSNWYTAISQASLTQGKWLWVKTVYTYSDTTTSTSYSKSYIGTDGEDGKSVYVQSSSKVDGTTTIVLTDGTTSTTLTIDDGTDGTNGINGINGTSEYMHIAWANSADGSTDFSTSVSANKSYIGVYSDENETDSELYGDYNWSLIKGADGQDGADGRGISQTEIRYGYSSNATDTPASWSETVPSLSSGQWLWVRTIYTYSDNSRDTFYNKSYIGTDGEDGSSVYIQSSSKTDGTTTLVLTDGTGSTTLTIDDGTDGNNGTNGLNGYVHVAWANSADGSVDFSTSVSTNKTYIGVYSDNTETDSIRYQDYSWSLIKGAKGDTGKQGVSVSRIVNYYLATSAGSGVTTSTSGWTTTIQTMTSSNQYLWNYEEVIGSENFTLNTTTPVIIGRYGQNGSNGNDGNDGRGIVSITEYYAKSTSNSVAPTSWDTTVPTIDATDKYLWNYEVIAYTTGSPDETDKRVIGTYGDKGDTGDDGRSVYVQSASKLDGTTTVVLTDGTDTTTLTIDDGADGNNGTNGLNGYVHVAWANSADGSTDFSTSVSANKTYIGVYTDNTAADSTRYQDYSWSLITGTGVTSVVRYYQTATSQPSKPTDNVYPPSSPWSDTEPTIDTTKTMYAVDCVVFTDGTSVYSDVMVVAAYEGAKQAISAVDNMVIGGRNLCRFKDSVAGYMATGITETMYNQTATKERTTDYIPIEASTEYVLQTWYDTSNPTSSYQWISLKWFTDEKAIISEQVREHLNNNNYKDYYLTSPSNAAYVRISARWQESDYWYQKVKLEKGNKGTDWTPAPEDTEAKIESVYGTCSTATATAAKVVTLSGFSLYRGAQIAVQFINGNSASPITLNVNSTDAIQVKVNDSGDLTGKLDFAAKTTATFVYDGTYWRYTGSDNLENEITWTENGGLNIKNKSEDLINGTSRVNIVGDAVNIYTGNGSGGEVLGSRIDADGMEIYDANGTMIASFGENAQIGANNSGRFILQSNAFYRMRSDGVATFGVGTLNDSTTKTFIFNYIGDGSNNERVPDSEVPIQINSVYYYDTQNSEWVAYSSSDVSLNWHIAHEYGLISTPAMGTSNIMPRPPANDYYYFYSSLEIVEGTQIKVVYEIDDRIIDVLNFGYNNTSSGDYAAAIGISNEASGSASVAMGNTGKASGDYSFAFNGNASGYSSVVLGNYGIASGAYSFAINGTASGNFSCAIGYKSTSSGEGSYAEGFNTTASGDRSHAEGTGTIASAFATHAEGIDSNATFNGAHAEGSSSATNYCAHSEGGNTRATAFYSHAEGRFTLASGSSSHAQNYNTIAASAYQTAMGKYNVEDNADTYALIIGNGTTVNARSNALTVDWSGNLWIAGGISVPSINLVDSNSATLATINNNGTAPYYTLGARASGSTIGDYSFANGIDITASGECSFASGKECVASADRAVAFGLRTTAAYGTQTVIGYYNDNTSGNIFEIGNGTDDNNRSNAFSVTTSGNVTAAGSITADGRVYGATETYTVTLPSSFTATSFSLCRNGGVAMLSIINVKTLNAQETAITTLPVGWRPKHNTAFVFNAPSAGVGSDLRINIYADGRVTIYNYGSAINSSSGSNKSGTFTYVLA